MLTSTFILIDSDQERVSNPCRAVTKRKRKDCFRIDLGVVQRLEGVGDVTNLSPFCEGTAIE